MSMTGAVKYLFTGRTPTAGAIFSGHFSSCCPKTPLLRFAFERTGIPQVASRPSLSVGVRLTWQKAAIRRGPTCETRGEDRQAAFLTGSQPSLRCSFVCAEQRGLEYLERRLWGLWNLPVGHQHS